MSSWSYSTPPVWAPTAIATPGGWTNPLTGEVLVAIRDLVNRTADIAIKLTFTAELLSDPALTIGQRLIIGVTPSEDVKIAGTLYIPLTVGGIARQAKFNGMSGGKLLFNYTTTVAAAAGEVIIGTTIDGSGSMFDSLSAGGQSVVATDDLVFASVDASAVVISAPVEVPAP